VARYLRDRDLQRDINEGLNVVESHNRGQQISLYGKGGELATNRRDERELPSPAFGSCRPRWSTSNRSCSRASWPTLPGSRR
jgi:Tn3 transposase DDE domain